MVVKRLSNPLIFATIICILIFLLNQEKLGNTRPIKSCVPLDDIIIVDGLVNSSPQINSSGKYYSVELIVRNCESTEIKSSARGTMKVMVPSEIVESYFPGKLYTAARNKSACFIESGTDVRAKGRYYRNSFYVESIIECGFPQKGASLKKFRSYARLKFRRMMYSWGNAGGLVLSLLSGSREYTDKNASDSFRKAGLSHVLALSGMHLSILMGIAVYAGEKLKYKKIMLMLQLVSITVFVWFAGLSPSLLRAFICSFVLLFEEIISLKKSEMIEVLCFTFIVQLILRPQDITSMGFILSYGALCGILLFSKFFSRMFSKYFPQKIATSVSASSSAQIATIPVTLKFFGCISPIGVISTVFVSPLISIFIYSAMILIVVCSVFPAFVGAGGFFLNLQYNLIVMLVDFFARFPQVVI